MVRSALIPIVLWAAGCSLSDIRPEKLINNELPAQAEQQGRAWLAKAARAQGGAALTTKQTVSFWLRDDWPSALMRWAAMPWETNKQLLRLDMAVGTDNGRLEYLEGERKGTGWGIQNWATYRFDGSKTPQFDDASAPDDEIKFWIPTIAYFPLLAWRIQDADVVRYVGTQKLGDREVAVVFASWGTDSPQKTVDQYLVWIDTSTNLLAGVRYTVRDMMGWIVGTMKYSDYKEVDGIKFPSVLNTVADLTSDETENHRMTIERFAFDDGLTAADLVPQPALRATK